MAPEQAAAQKAVTPPKVERATSPYFQLIFIALTGIILSYLLYVPAVDFSRKRLEQLPEIEQITPQTLAKFGGSPARVKVGLFIRDFPEFDILKNEFVFSGIISFEFDPSVVSLETVGKFTFQKGEILEISAPYTQMKDGLLFARYTIRVRFKTNLNHRFFPFTDYAINIVLDNYVVTPGELIYGSSVTQFITAPRLHLSGWTEVDRHVYAGYFVDQLDALRPDQNVYHPRVVFTIDYKRAGLRQMISILLPLVLVFFISIFSLSMDPEQYYRSILTLSSGAVTALLAYKFVIDNLAPRVGYFMLSDLIYFLFLTVIFVIFFFNTRTLTLSGRTKQIITILVHTIVILACIYLFRLWGG